MLTFDRDHKRFNIRVGGVALHKGLLLTERDSRFDFYVVPGGRGEFHESTRSTLAREILEELGVPAQREMRF
jgi:8-oxo-dGTP pyrophosphatase MutT (NUDIX family)